MWYSLNILLSNVIINHSEHDSVLYGYGTVIRPIYRTKHLLTGLQTLALGHRKLDF